MIIAKPCVILCKNTFIGLKENNDSKSFKNNDISCIGIKKDIAPSLIQVMDDIKLEFDDLPDITQNLVKTIYNFIKSKNS